MKKNLRQKNSIIIWFIFYIILLLSITLFIILSLMPSVNDIETKKEDTRDLYEKLVNVKKKWINYNTFKKLTILKRNSKEYKNILSNLTEDFYINNLSNTWSISFNDFINNKTKEFSNDENTKIIAENDKQIFNILPTYSDKNINIWENILTDFEFINYIESIIFSFNLTNNDSIGIWNVVILDDYVNSLKDWGTYDSNIYEIPLNLNLNWRKKDIIDFLYFIEKVWTIKVNNNKMVVNTDSAFLSINDFPKVLVWDKYSSDYKIFEKQIIDINNITFNWYLDTSYKVRDNQNFIDFVKEKEWNDKFDIKVNLAFYVKWFPKYKVLNYINNIINNFKNLNKYINSTLSTWKVKWSRLNILRKKQELLKNLNKRVINLNKGVKQEKGIESIYLKAIEINNVIQPLCEEYDKNKSDDGIKVCK